MKTADFERWRTLYDEMAPAAGPHMFVALRVWEDPSVGTDSADLFRDSRADQRDPYNTAITMIMDDRFDLVSSGPRYVSSVVSRLRGTCAAVDRITSVVAKSLIV